MREGERYDVVCVGAGIVGTAIAMSLTGRFSCSVAVVEAEDAVATHQTGHNSGVLHSGLYYTPGSRKARNCVEGRRRLIEFCQQRDIPHEICGKLVVAVDRDEIPRLDELERRGRANGLEGLRRVAGAEIAEYEPHTVGADALWVPETGIIDFARVARAFADEVRERDGNIYTGSRVVGVRAVADEVVVETTAGRFRCAHLINCAGLQSDRIARLAGASPGLRIVPFRGEYFVLAADRRHLVRNLIYPVPDPRFPFLGVHLTRGIDGEIEAGPNAVLALDREGYARRSVSLRDSASSLLYPGFWRLAARYWRTGAAEFLRAGNPRRFARALRRFVPDIVTEDLRSGGCGIRAQALDRSGNLLDDFAIVEHERTLHVLNAPSPAATASMAIGRSLAEMAAEKFGLRERS